MLTRRNAALVVSVLMLGYLVGSCTPTGPGGAASPNGIVYDAKFVTNPARAELTGTGTWVALPDAATTIDVTTAPVTLVARFWAANSCTGTGAKYVRILVDGAQEATAPMEQQPRTSVGVQEANSTVEGSRSVSPGSHTVQVQVKIDAGSACVITADLWHLDLEILGV